MNRVIQIVDFFRKNVSIAFDKIGNGSKPFLAVYTYVNDYVKKVVGYNETEDSVTLKAIGNTTFTEGTESYTKIYPTESGVVPLDRTIDILTIRTVD